MVMYVWQRLSLETCWPRRIWQPAIHFRSADEQFCYFLVHHV
jgi:hypothetical protein